MGKWKAILLPEVVDHSFFEQNYTDPPIQPAGTNKREGSSLLAEVFDKRFYSSSIRLHINTLVGFIPVLIFI